MLTLLRLTSPLLQGHLARYCFSARQLSETAQRAAWSSAFVKEIANPVLPTKPQDHSLLNRLTELQLESNEFTFDEKIRQQEIVKFTQGVQLQSKAFNLNRIIYSQTYRKKKLIFKPNLLYTSQIFRVLMKTGSITLLCGRQEIGKTFSILLFTLLSKNVHRLMLEAKQDSKLSDELAQLKSHNFIVDVPKYWYWNIKQRKEKRTEKHFHKILLQQATQLPSQEKARLYYYSTYDDLLEQLNRVYSSAGIKQQFCIDQLDNAIKQIKANEEGTKTSQINEQSAYINASEFIDKFKKIGLGGYYPFTYDIEGEVAYRVSGKIDSLSQLDLYRTNKPSKRYRFPITKSRGSYGRAQI